MACANAFIENAGARMNVVGRDSDTPACTGSPARAESGVLDVDSRPVSGSSVSSMIVPVCFIRSSGAPTSGANPPPGLVLIRPVADLSDEHEQGRLRSLQTSPKMRPPDGSALGTIEAEVGRPAWRRPPRSFRSHGPALGDGIGRDHATISHELGPIA